MLWQASTSMEDWKLLRVGHKGDLDQYAVGLACPMLDQYAAVMEWNSSESGYLDNSATNCYLKKSNWDFSFFSLFPHRGDLQVVMGMFVSVPVFVGRAQNLDHI